MARTLSTVTEYSDRTREWPITSALAVMAVGLGIIAADHFRIGSLVMSASVWRAVALRASLADEQAGILVVRARHIDLAIMATLALALTAFSIIVPPPR